MQAFTKVKSEEITNDVVNLIKSRCGDFCTDEIIIHTDQGTEFASKSWQGIVKKVNLEPRYLLNFQ